jgi:hypothetical protein
MNFGEIQQKIKKFETGQTEEEQSAKNAILLLC